MVVPSGSHGGAPVAGCHSLLVYPSLVLRCPQVVATVAEFLKNTSMAAMPLYAQGYSSGGTMLLKLPGFLDSK